MTTHSVTRACLLAVVAVGLIGAVGTGGSLAAFSDATAGNGSFSAAEDFGGGVPAEDMDQAFNDADADGYYDEGEETTYSAGSLTNFDEPDANLVIPESVGSVDNQNGVSITAGSIDSRGDIRSENGDIDITATTGDVELIGANLTGSSGGLSISADGNITVDGSTLRKQWSDISLDGAWISAIGTQFETTSSPITLTSSNNINLNSSRFESQYADASVTLGSNSTLFIDQAEIHDSDDELIYSPTTIEVVGSVSTGNVSS